jgi:peptidoglycan hydrolase CwlO-like protein
MKQWLYIAIIVVLAAATVTIGYFYIQKSNQLQTAISDRSALSASLSNVQSSLESATSRINALSNENSSLKASSASLQARLNALTASNTSLEAQLNSATSTIASLNTQVQSINNQLKSLQNSQQLKSNQILSLQDQLSDAFTQWTFYKKELTKSEAHIAWLEAGLLQLQPTNPLLYSTPPDNSPVGVVNLTTAPTGASVIIDGTDSGSSPLTVTLSRGPHTVSASLTGYVSANQTITISSGNNGNILILWQ